MYQATFGTACNPPRKGAESREVKRGHPGLLSKTIEASPLQSGKRTGAGAPTPEEIRAELQNLLLSPSFHGSRRCQQFLEFVCLEFLGGRQDNLKERYLAVEVFGRPPESDLSEDTIVRVGAREVRKRLAQHYVSDTGVNSAVRISLPSGSYVPEFRYQNQAVEVPPVPSLPVEEIAIVAAPAPRWLSRRALALVGAGAALVAIAAAAWYLSGRNVNIAAYDKFWAPVLRTHDPLLIAVAHPLVYMPSRRAAQLNAELHPPAILGQSPLQLPPKMLDGSDFVAVPNQFVGFGDMEVSTEIAAMLAQRGKPVRVRLASAVEFADLRNVQTLLVGAITNRWTVQLQSAWRFQFASSPNHTIVIADTQSARSWSIPSKEDGSTPEDYMLLCRIRDSETNGFILAAAGLKQFGTEAAAHLLADPEQLGAILRQLPTGWEGKNLQLVFHARVIGNTPARPDLVDSHSW